ncbi:ABC transporter substrate-binding protein [Nocardioides mangrovi]|uniref:ABC transporter substrate-binding protein n=1 Tax=Nocardioides mangrovi TaxID=2874580 RepID=A0ABS7UEC8_9ACTN|nr:ABC transporter substrate-binding protein [Nocardioides mangrovi]MBZ5739358.1 ABC transporter substrate-binding protein [Nocardioides mangrovi]
MTVKKTVAGLALAGAVGLVLSACSSSDSPLTSGGGGAATGTINTELWYAPTVFDPSQASADADTDVARLGFDTLLRKGESSGYIGGLATSWKADSNTEYTFDIRDDATCSDGTAITPSVVAASLDYLATSKNSSAATNKISIFGSGTPTFTPDDDAGTLTVSLSEPYSELFAGLTNATSGIICPAGLDDPKGLAKGTVDGAWSGPYTLTGLKAGVSATYTLRDDYDAWPDWSDVTGTPAKTINITVSTDSNTSANLLTSGGIDVTRFYDSNAERFTSGKGYTYVTMPSSAYTLILNEHPGALFADDQDLRTAVAQAIDPDGFNSAGLDGLGTSLTSVDPSTVSCTIDGSSILPGVDVDAAEAKLSGTTIRLLAMSNWDPAIDYLAEALRAAGATVKVSTPDAAEWQTQMRTEPDKWDIALNATSVSNPLSETIATYVGPTSDQGGRNIGGADNTEGYQHLQAALAASDEDTQCSEFEAAQTSILTRADMVPLITDTHYVIARDGFATSVFSGYWDISSMRITS